VVNEYDVAIVGGGPAGATCAAICAGAGLKTVLLERATFPREKVCGDCLNPGAWPVLERLGVAEGVIALPHSRLAHVEFIGLDGRHVRFPLPSSERGTIAVKRSLFDKLLLDRARELGADVREASALTAIERGWLLHVSGRRLTARFVVAADGRNSTVARLLELLPSPVRDRVAVQTHLRAPPDFGERVVMQFHERGYSGLASVGGGELNLCLVARAPHLDALKAWATEVFSIPTQTQWHTVTPLARRSVNAAHPGLLLTGDAARVLEPFTGEGITYALKSGALAADHVISGDPAGYGAEHRALYRGRLWINRLARFACEHPRAANWALKHPKVLGYLTRKIINSRTAQ
jgi:flavin-dependent dehydrogenase